MGLRKLTPGGHEYLTGSVACGDRALEPGEALSDYYFAHGYPPGQWIGRGAADLGLSGQVTAAQMNALFGEGRHPNADAIEVDLIRAGATLAEVRRATQLGRRFARYDSLDDIRSQVLAAYKQYYERHRDTDTPLDDAARDEIRHAVQVRAFRAAHDDRPPANRSELNSWLADEKRQLRTPVAGYEAVFAPSKSVSVAWALSDDTTRARIRDLHRQAVEDTIHQFENTAAFTRQGSLGEAQVDVEGITAATFEHWDSRAGDPHLHTHVPISAKVRRATDGTWTALDGRTVLAATVTMSEFYNSRIRDLFREQGAHWVQRPADGVDLKRPVWELEGVPQELLLRFSQRAQQVELDRANRIVAFRREYGREPNPKELLEIGRRAQYGTRMAKQAPRSLNDHLREWQSFAATLVEPSTLDDLASRVFGEGEQEQPIDVQLVADTTRAVVSDHYSHWNRWNVEAEAHRQTAHLRVPPEQRDALIRQVTDAVVDGAVALQAPALVAEPPRLRRRSGESVFVEHNAQRYTTEQTLREEAALVAWSRLGGGQRLTPDTVARALAGQKLNAGQERMVREFALSGRRAQLALAPAGAGKTTALRVLARAWRRAGGRIYAFGPSARAAHELSDAIDAQPHTLHQVTTALAVGVAADLYPFGRGDLLIVDEAAMAGTHTLHEVMGYALRRGADVRLVGDDRQLDAVEAGGAIRLIAQDVGAVRFQEVVRFADPRQAAASLRIRSGDVAGLNYYLDRGWVHGGSRETIRDAAHRAWRADLDRGRHSLLIVPTNEDVVWLNLQARAQRIERGDVADQHDVTLHDGTRASPGDWIVTRENNRLLTVFSGRDFVKNGDTWVVTAVRQDQALAVVNLANNSSVVLPPSYVAANVELAYATTVHRTQGMTSQGSAHAIVPQGMTREQLYPAITRARFDNRVYVETHQHVADDHRETPPKRTAKNVLASVVKRSEAETSATEQLRASLGVEESLSTLVTRHDYAARLGTDERLTDLLARHAPHTVGQAAEPALLQTLRNATDLGWRADHLVTAAAREGDLTRTNDPAAVLQWRIVRRINGREPPVTTTPALPWMSRTKPDADLTTYLQELNTAVTARVNELRSQTAGTEPPWLAGIGPRPTDTAVTEWEDLVGLAAAYRETFRITSADPTQPLGPEPSTADAKAQAWRDLTERINQLREQAASFDTPSSRYHGPDESADEGSQLDAHAGRTFHLRP